MYMYRAASPNDWTSFTPAPWIIQNPPRPLGDRLERHSCMHARYMVSWARAQAHSKVTVVIADFGTYVYCSAAINPSFTWIVILGLFKDWIFSQNLHSTAEDILMKWFLKSWNDIAFVVGPGYRRLPTGTNDMTGICHENQWPVGCRWLPTNDRCNIISAKDSISFENLRLYAVAGLQTTFKFQLNIINK